MSPRRKVLNDARRRGEKALATEPAAEEMAAAAAALIAAGGSVPDALEGLRQELINPLTGRLAAHHFNRRTLDTVRRAGIDLDSERRAWLGIFVLAAGRAPAR